MKYIKPFEHLNEHIDYIVKEKLTQDDIDKIEDAFILDIADKYEIKEIKKDGYLSPTHPDNGGPFSYVNRVGYLTKYESKVFKIFIIKSPEYAKSFNQSMKKLKNRLMRLGYDSIGHPYISKNQRINLPIGATIDFSKRYELFVYKKMFAVRKRVDVRTTKPVDKRYMKY